MSANVIYTIGHSNASVEFFIGLLKKYGINCLVDVRSMPFSKHTPQFNQSELKKVLFKYGIKYVAMGEEFGARRSDPSLYTNGYLDFEKTARSTLFLNGIKRVNAGMTQGFCIALMCTEKDPLACHRFSLVARAFHNQGRIVKHILHDGSVKTHEELEESLVSLYFPHKKIEISLFNEESLSDEQLIQQAYEKKNAEIGYRQAHDQDAAML